MIVREGDSYHSVLFGLINANVEVCSDSPPSHEVRLVLDSEVWLSLWKSM